MNKEKNSLPKTSNYSKSNLKKIKSLAPQKFSKLDTATNLKIDGNLTTPTLSSIKKNSKTKEIGIPRIEHKTAETLHFKTFLKHDLKPVLVQTLINRYEREKAIKAFNFLKAIKKYIFLRSSKYSKTNYVKVYKKIYKAFKTFVAQIPLDEFVENRPIDRDSVAVIYLRTKTNLLYKEEVSTPTDVKKFPNKPTKNFEYHKQSLQRNIEKPIENRDSNQQQRSSRKRNSNRRNNLQERNQFQRKSKRSIKFPKKN